MKWLYRIFRLFVCPHKYTIVEEIKLYCGDSILPAGTKFIIQCKRCGKIKSHRV